METKTNRGSDEGKDNKKGKTKLESQHQKPISPRRILQYLWESKFSILNSKIFPGKKNKSSNENFKIKLGQLESHFSLNDTKSLHPLLRSFYYRKAPCSVWYFPSGTPVQVKEEGSTLFSLSPDKIISIPFIFVFLHGNDCNIEDFLEFYQAIGETCNAVVIAPEYAGYESGFHLNVNPTPSTVTSRLETILKYIWSCLALGISLPETHNSESLRQIEEGKQEISPPSPRIMEWEKLLRSRTFVIGHSLGCALALSLAKIFPDLGGLVLFSPFTKSLDVLSHLFRKYPKSAAILRSLCLEKFDNSQIIEETNIPICIYGGTEDNITPRSMAETLFALAANRQGRLCQLVVLQDGNHQLPNFISILPSLWEFLQNWSSYPGLPPAKLAQRHTVYVPLGESIQKSLSRVERQVLQIQLSKYQEKVNQQFLPRLHIRFPPSSFVSQGFTVLELCIWHQLQLEPKILERCNRVLVKEVSQDFALHILSEILFVVLGVILVLVCLLVFSISMWLATRKRNMRI